MKKWEEMTREEKWDSDSSRASWEERLECRRQETEKRERFFRLLPDADDAEGWLRIEKLLGKNWDDA